LTAEAFSSLSVQASVTCNPTGSSTLTFTATGTATGPYPGTFTETGTAAFGPGPAKGGTVLTAFDAQFTISSPVGNVTGAKHLVVPGAGLGAGSCADKGTAIIYLVTAQDLNYAAEITTPAGDRFTDQGTNPSTVILYGKGFSETFASSLTAPVPVATPGCDSNGQSTGNDQCGQTQQGHGGRRGRES
jgi:hypothetical protein